MSREAGLVSLVDSKPSHLLQAVYLACHCTLTTGCSTASLTLILCLQQSYLSSLQTAEI